MEKLRLESTKVDTAWNSLMESSANGTIFGRSELVGCLNHRVAAYLLKVGQETRGGVLVPESSDGEDAVLHDLIIYDGVMFKPPPVGQNHATVMSEQFGFLSFVAEELTRRYRNVEMQFHPSLRDIRPFLWMNYGTDRPKFVPDVRYTSYLDVSKRTVELPLEEHPCFLQCAYARRQEIRNARRQGVRTIEDFRPQLFLDFYCQTMGRQGIDVSPPKREEMQRVLEGLVQGRIGRMFVSLTGEGVPGSMAFFGLDSKRAYYLFGANDPQFRNSHTGTAVLWDAFGELSRSGVATVDLEGVNSPRRGWFKLSFGGELIAYYALSYHPPV